MWLIWSNDDYGNQEQALYLNNLFTGNIIELTHHNEERAKKPWRAWVMSDPSGEHVGWYASKEEAQQALLNRVHELIGEVI
jgi:hypothetical protein